ncbi:MAG: DUF1848 domain-containing protein [Tannerella sp.]|jgi:hypothetical protein|nr:DUF1848 domain-containing protein [Tannerella sp.]
MILSISRRTDIPAFYSKWFFNRVREGFVYVRNPVNVHQISRIPVDPDQVECMVFWTKNPAPMLPRLDEIKPFAFYFQFTLTPYGRDLEVRLPDKDSLVETFRRLSGLVGPERVIWRYDPILMSHGIGEDWHLAHFEALAGKLATHTKRCVISFIDPYRKTEKNLRGTTVRVLRDTEIISLAGKMALIAQRHGMELQTCAETCDLTAWGIGHGKCIDDRLIESISGASLRAGKDKNQRPACRCIESVDIGAYNTCLHGCLYCYANASPAEAFERNRMHHPESPLPVGNVSTTDIVRERNG